MLLKDTEHIDIVSDALTRVAAQVSALVLQAVSEKKIKVTETAITQVLEDWTGTVYSDELAKQRYKALANFPLAKPPADSDDQLPVTKIQINDAGW